MKTPPTPKHPESHGGEGRARRFNQIVKHKNHFPLQCKEIKDRLNALYGSRGLCQPQIAARSDEERKRRGDDDRGEERGREERRGKKGGEG